MREKLSSLPTAHKQIIKFLIVGAISTILDWGVYYILTRHTIYFEAHLIGAKTLSSFSASISAFLLNRFWSFRKSDKVTFFEVMRFYISGSIGIGINVLITYFCIHVLHIYDLVAIVIATVLTFSWNFTVNKYWVFQK